MFASKAASIFYVDRLGGRGGFQKIYVNLQGGRGGSRSNLRRLSMYPFEQIHDEFLE